MSRSATDTRRLEWLVLAALFAITLASRWTLVAEHGSPVPFHDQWSAEGQAILEPWFAGNLGWSDIWKPSNEHRPVLTRLLVLVEFSLTGEWNTRLQMLVNSLFYALTAVALSRIARTILGVRGWLAATAVIALLFALQGNYENTTWGFQSQVYLMVLLGVLYLSGTFGSSRIGTCWCAAQAAGALGLFATAGGILAPVAAAGIAAARFVRRRSLRDAATVVSATALAFTGWWMLPASAGSGPLQAGSAMLLVEALVKLLAWPSPLALAAAFIHLPFLLIAVRALAAREDRPGDLLLASAGLWVCLEALVIAWSRGGWISEIPPRYYDILVIGLAVNAACAGLLVRGRARKVIPVGMLAIWLATIAAGLWHFNRPSRLQPVIASHAALHRGTLEAVRDYIRTGEPGALTRDPFIAHHLPPVSATRRLLDNPGIRASLPSAVRGDPVPTVTEQLTGGILGSWPWVAGLGVAAFFAASTAILVRSKREPAAAAQPVPVPWLAASLVPALAAVGLVAFGMHPWDSDPHKRFARAFTAAGAPVADFDIAGAAGAVYVTPETPAAFLRGTLIGGDAFQGEKASTVFALDRKFVVVPVTGYPELAGNSLRLELLAPDGSVARRFDFSGASPRERIRAWNVAVDAEPGSRARLVLVDGTQGMGGWLGAGTPLQTDDPDAARRLDIALAEVGANNARRFPAALLAAAVVCAAIGLFGLRSAARGGLASVEVH